MKTTPRFLPSSSASLRSILVLAVAAGVSLPSVAQTAHHTAAAHHAASGCVTIPELSPKIPALPAGTPCPKSLFTFTTNPGIRLDYVSPLVTPEVREALGISPPTTFSLAYSETKVGTGEPALPHKFYTMKYTGYLTDGSKFDSTDGKKQGFTFPIGAHQVIAGWDLGMQGMRIGGKRRLYIPWELAYGDKGRPGIPPRSELIFDIELVSQSDKGPEPPAGPAMPHPAMPAPMHPGAAPAPAAPAPKTPPPASTTTPPNTTAPKP